MYFYYNYIPNLSFTVPVHLQYDFHNQPEQTLPRNLNPYGISALTMSSSSSPVLVSQQKYDFSVQLRLPRNPNNVHAGNFMIALDLKAPTARSTLPHQMQFSDLEGFTPIASSMRPTSLTYISPLLEKAQKAAALPLYLTGWKQELETLHVPLMEGISFEKDWRRIPKVLMLVVSSTTRLQIYDCHVHITARLSGIRWLMYNYRVSFFVLLTTIFWTVEMYTALCVFLIASLLLPSSTPKTRSQQSIEQDLRTSQRPVKREQAVDEEDDDIDNLSDTSRNFPTFSRQPPLHYSSGRDARVKVEDADEQEVGTRAGQTADADVSATDTDEDADFVLQEPESAWKRERFFRDSGLGTSFESGSGSGSAARRRSAGRGGTRDTGT